jgi:hypothetical protein
VLQPYVIKETQYSDIVEISDNGKREQTGQQFFIEATSERSPVTHQKQPAIASNAASPSCSEFEAFLDRASASAVAPKQSSKNDAMLGDDSAHGIEARMISVDDIMLGDDSADDNLSIAATLPEKNRNLSLLVDVATKPFSSPSVRKKKTPKKGFYS